MLLAAPVITAVAPADSGAATAISAHISASFSAPVDPASISATTFRLRDVSGDSIPGRVSYNPANNTATFDPASPLDYSTAYTATLVGGSGGVKDRASGTPLASNFTWSFQTALAPTDGPGGPILVVVTSANPFTSYYAEILRAEGLNEFATADISTVNSTMLGGYDVVILGQMSLSASQVTMFSNYVNAGGDLIAMRPDKQLAGLLGLGTVSGTITNGYIGINTGSGPGVGITDQTIQFHGAADVYTLNGATPVATLYSSANTSTQFPAVTLRSVGSGRAAAFTYDLAQSIIYTRQGNPAWAGQDRDGISPVRSDDMFYGNASFDRQADWIDLSKVAIPQADEQQRLLANMVTQMEQDRMPLPRFWYFPNGTEAMVLMTGDDHASGGTSGRFDTYLADGTSGGMPIRSTSYVLSGEPMSNTQAAAYVAQGFEVALHVNTGCVDFTSYADLDSDFSSQLAAFLAQYPSLPTPSTERTHCIVWSDYATEPQVQLAHRIRLDTNYYYYPPAWMADSPGMFTGSGLPMRFATADGQIIDVYQAATQMTDESGQRYPFTIDALLDKATGSLGYYGVFTANMHTDSVDSSGSNAIIASAQAHGVPVVSAEYVLNWIDGRNGSSFSNLSWRSGTSTLTFSIDRGVGADGLQAMLPAHGPGGAVLDSISDDSGDVPFSTQVIKGIEYALFDGAAGAYIARYSGGTILIPTVTSQSPAPNAVGVPTDTTVSVTFNESVVSNSISFILRNSSGNTVPASVAYNNSTRTATLTPASALAAGMTYSATVSGAADADGNTMATPVSWSFVTAAPTSGAESLWGKTAIPANPSVADAAAVELGVKFRSDVAGLITGIRFYKGPSNTGTHTGSLWSSSGTRLATATFTNETASGWQQVNFSRPVSIEANTTYVASYHTNTGFYAGDNNYFATGLDNAPLHALSSSSSGGNGVYRYGASAFPDQSWNASNYWVDVAFIGADTTAPTVTAQSPAPNATGVSTSTTVTATFSESVLGSSISFMLKDASGTTVAGSTAYNDTTRTATFTPTAAIAAGTIYTATVSGAKDAAGNGMAAPVSWSFTTAAAVTGTYSLWSNTAIPATASTADAAAVEVGVKFRSDVAGLITGIRFYKGSLNTGTHSGTLWSGTGEKLATATFANETASGWQQVLFTTPVAIQANTIYVASYHTNTGYYSSNTNYFTTGVDNAPLHAPASSSSGGNGVYRYGTSAFPNSTWNACNYWVDVVFSSGPDTTPPTITAQSPAPNATDVSAGTTVTATFNESVIGGSVAFALKDAAGATVAASVSYDDTTRTVTLTPTSALAAGTTYTATVSGATDSSGNIMAAPVSWSFTTAAASSTTYSLFAPAATPAIANSNDGTTIEVGVKFTTDVPGYITGVRFYKGSANTGTHTAHLWSSTGQLLATATFSNETASGWQQVSFSTPVLIQPNTTYIVSYWSSSGYYSGTTNYFASTVSSGPLHAPTSASSGGNGVYRYGASAFPNLTWNASNYWVDVVFQPA